MGTVFKSCKKCTERIVGCQSWCKRYLAEKKKHDELMEDIRTKREADCYIIEHQKIARGKAAKKKQRTNTYDYK